MAVIIGAYKREIFQLLCFKGVEDCEHFKTFVRLYNGNSNKYFIEPFTPAVFQEEVFADVVTLLDEAIIMHMVLSINCRLPKDQKIHPEFSPGIEFKLDSLPAGCKLEKIIHWIVPPPSIKVANA